MKTQPNLGMKYAHQFIIYFTGGGDDIPEQNAEALVAKAAYDGVLDKTIVIPFNEPLTSCTYIGAMKEEQNHVTDNERIYIVGHGTDTSESVGNCNAEDWAKTIKALAGTHKIKRVSFVACHSGAGNQDQIAPHRFVVDFFKHAKDFVTEATGYTGTVRMNFSAYQPNPLQNPPADAVAYQSWNGEVWWVKAGMGRKIVGHQHSEDDQRRKIYVRADAIHGESKGWTNKL